LASELVKNISATVLHILIKKCSTVIMAMKLGSLNLKMKLEIIFCVKSAARKKAKQEHGMN
jgi:hypothetical protein